MAHDVRFDIIKLKVTMKITCHLNVVIFIGSLSTNMLVLNRYCFFFLHFSRKMHDLSWPNTRDMDFTVNLHVNM